MSLIIDNETTMTLSDRNHMCKFSSFTQINICSHSSMFHCHPMIYLSIENRGDAYHM